MRSDTILIVEPDLGPFVLDLQAAVDDTGAQSLVARDPSAALERCEQFNFSAALVNAEHRSLLEELAQRDVLALIYVRTEAPTAIIASMQRLLAA